MSEKLQSAVVHATSSTKQHLYIVLYSRLFAPDVLSRTQSWSDIHEILTLIYVAATKVAQDSDKILMDIDVLLKVPNELYDLSVQMVYTIDGGEQF